MNRKEALEAGEKTYDGKPCKNCGTTLKNVSDYGCVECNRERARKLQAEKRADGRNKEVRRRYEQGEAGKAARARYNSGEAGRANNWKYQIQRRYGISGEQYETMLTEQEYSCKICGCSVEDNGKSLAVDHCHDTGKVRDLLCHNCNVGLGNFKDNVELMMKAIEYLKDHT